MTVTLRLHTTYNMVLNVLRKNLKTILNQQQASHVSTLNVGTLSTTRV